MTDLSKHEKIVDRYVEQNRTEEAVKLLFQLIVKYAKEKNFEKAEALRDRLFEIDAMALDEIIKSAEIIEQEKSEAMDHNHMDIWSDFYSTLTTEEKNIFYFSLKKADYGPDEPVFLQKEKNQRLYFVNQGQLKLFFSQNDTEQLIKTLRPGCIGGEDTFFSISLCTTSLVTLSPVRLNYLEQSTFLEWQVKYPALTAKLQSFCNKKGISGPDILKKKGINRRAHERFKVSGSIRFQVLNASGKPIGKAFKGDLSDISVGGLSFFIKTANRKNALTLLGRRLRVRFVIPVGETEVEAEQAGAITGVINHLFSDYSIHMKFDRPLSKTAVEKVGMYIEAGRRGGHSGKADKTAV
ncbi:hypothetical protein DENIS_0622 [Desulfonema ishimotonii]|uniref:Cyclic nucleotide-binding domain-containing protein n=1 Tax=Desulfonema ishimotonii TaxID=45657 RepID=A0A401FRU4_9BACT|nr:cyclic nucleotide-binding domain-containing protein [Desulfonema ishimotonii]GBC59681.1 hypothetical protein DENIS_0622 [Desulfonema ishimotonii]